MCLFPPYGYLWDFFFFQFDYNVPRCGFLYLHSLGFSTNLSFGFILYQFLSFASFLVTCIDL